MIVAAVKAAVVARVQADTGAGGLFASGANLINSITYWFEGRGSTTGIRGAQPAVAFDIPATNPKSGFTFDLREFYFRFHTLYPFTRNKDAAITAAVAIQNRLVGDWTAQANRTPSYGFDRHQLVITLTGLSAAPWVGGACEWTATNEAHTEDSLHFIDTFVSRVSRTRTLGYTS